jgi:hypothetical protein
MNSYMQTQQALANRGRRLSQTRMGGEVYGIPQVDQETGDAIRVGAEGDLSVSKSSGALQSGIIATLFLVPILLAWKFIVKK